MIRVGVVGLGAIGQEHVQIYRHLPGAELVAVADFDVARAQQTAEDLAIAAFGSAEELIESGTIDAISLCTPDHLHAADAAAAIESGVHLLLEKPVATTAAEAEELVRLSENSRVTVMPGHTLRFDTRYLALREQVQGGRIGEVVHGYARRNNKISVADRVGGRASVAFFLGIHDIDALSWVVGHRVTSVQARATRATIAAGTAAAAILATLEFANGAVVQLESAWDLPETYPSDLDARLRLVGTGGEISLDLLAQGVALHSADTRYPFPAGSVYGNETGALREELAAFVRAIHGDIELPITMREGVDAVHVALAIDRAVKSGKTENIEYGSTDE